LVTVGSASGVTIKVACYVRFRRKRPERRRGGMGAKGRSLGGGGTLSLALPGFLIHPHPVPKERERENLPDGLPLPREERVLDVCCGSGLLLIAAAKRLTNGTATGIDLWDADPFSGNKAQGVWFNTAAEGVPAHRIRLVTGDARQLPFADATFE